jgi:hypothetical protein
MEVLNKSFSSDILLVTRSLQRLLESTILHNHLHLNTLQHPLISFKLAENPFEIKYISDISVSN